MVIKRAHDLLDAGRFLVLSGACLVCLFITAGSENGIHWPSENLMNFQVIVTKIITTVFSAVNVLGLLYLSFVFIVEQWRFRQATGAIGRALTRHSLSARIINAFRGLFRVFRCDLQPLLRLHLLILITYKLV